MVMSEQEPTRDQMIVIVDDEPANAEMFSMMLEVVGFQTAVVHGTSTAIKAIQELKPDLVLLDVMMPGIDGLELCRYMKRDPFLAPVPVIMISARGRDDDVRAGMDAGADVYLIKPITKTQLMESVEHTLGLNTHLESR